MAVNGIKKRKRYVAFSVSPDVTKEAIIRGSKSFCQSDPVYVIQCTSGKAIIRCTPKTKDEAVIMMKHIDPSSSPLITSGTIRKIRALYPELKQDKK
jgi:RNase P/RNase MRP subunit POP5